MVVGIAEVAAKEEGGVVEECGLVDVMLFQVGE